MHTNHITGDDSSQNPFLPTQAEGGNSVGGNVKRADGSLENGMVPLQECLADPQAFLKRTRTHLQAITNTATEYGEVTADDFGSTGILRETDGSQRMQPFAILAPFEQRWGQDVKPDADKEGLRSTVSGSSDHSVLREFVPFVSPPSVSERFAMNARRGISTGSMSDPRNPRAEHQDADWRVANAFDRNAYYGPTDFGYMPDDAEFSIPANLCSSIEDHRIDAFCNFTPLSEFGTHRVSPVRVLSYSKLHLANKIRQN